MLKYLKLLYILYDRVELNPAFFVGHGLWGFRDDFDDLSHSKNHNATQVARQYLCMLMKAEKRNMQRMAEAVPDSGGSGAADCGGGRSVYGRIREN
jgi:hypothetical protein